MTMLVAKDYDAVLAHAEAAKDLGTGSGHPVFGMIAICAVLAARATGQTMPWTAGSRGARVPLMNLGGSQAGVMAAERALDQDEIDTAIDRLGESAREISESYHWSTAAASLVRLRLAQALLDRDRAGDRESAQAELDAAAPNWRKAKAKWYLGRLEAWAVERGLTFPAE